jgi:hypothetical protein
MYNYFLLLPLLPQFPVSSPGSCMHLRVVKIHIIHFKTILFYNNLILLLDLQRMTSIYSTQKKTSVPSSHTTPPVSTVTINRLMVYKEIIVAYCENHMTHINTLLKNVDVLRLGQIVHVVPAGLEVSTNLIFTFSIIVT